MRRFKLRISSRLPDLGSILVAKLGNSKKKKKENRISGRGRFNLRIRGFNLRIRGFHLRRRGFDLRITGPNLRTRGLKFTDNLFLDFFLFF